jgi:hypothetical protein
MKKLFFDKAHQPFLLTALIALSIAIFFKGAHPGSFFDIALYDFSFEISTSRAWFIFTGYLFFLALVYYIIRRARLLTKKWLVVSHYVFIVCFLIFFAAFSVFENPGFKALTKNIPFITLVSIYGVLFLFDVIFFAFGIILFIVNLVSLRKIK